jgi:hypothetical protein
MWTATNKIAAGIAGVALLVGSQLYGDWSSRSTASAHFKELEVELDSLRAQEAARVSELAKELDLLQERLGLSSQDLAATQKTAASIRQEQVKALAALRQTLAEHARTVDSLRAESGTQLDELRQQASSQIDAVSGAVTRVFGDVGVVKEDLAASRREIGDVRDALGRQIARNADELAVLKLRGEREFHEFDVRKNDNPRIAGIRLQLNKADTKARKYDVTLMVDDNKLQKKGQLLNEPIQMQVGKDRLRYELVVNSIDKDRIRGYISTPKAVAAGPGTLALSQ